MADEQPTILTSKLAVPFAGLVGGILAAATLLVGIIVWAVNVGNETKINTAEIVSLQVEIRTLENRTIDDGTRLTIVETNYKQILSTLADMKSSLDKIETKFSIK